jgi:hypothetical protein
MKMNALLVFWDRDIQVDFNSTNMTLFLCSIGSNVTLIFPPAARVMADLMSLV